MGIVYGCMRRKLLWMPVAVVTVMLGTALLMLPHFRPSGLSNCVIDLKPIKVDHVDCGSYPQFPGRAVAIAKVQPGLTGYFPQGMYAYGWRDRETFMNEWYGKHLKAMREPSLLEESRSDTDVYRFLWLRTFHNPMAVRVERSGSAMKLYLKELSGSGGYDPGELIVSKQIDLDQSQWCGFMSRLEQSNYWNRPLEEENGGLDGAQWILEGASQRRYHAVDRWTPRDGDYREACMYLLELAGVDTAKMGTDFY